MSNKPRKRPARRTRQAYAIGPGVGMMMESPTRADIKLIQEAAMGKWEIPDEAYRVLPNVALKIVKDEDERAAIRTQAGRLLAQLNEQNETYHGEPNEEANVIDVNLRISDPKQAAKLCELAEIIGSEEQSCGAGDNRPGGDERAVSGSGTPEAVEPDARGVGGGTMPAADGDDAAAAREEPSL